MHASCAKGGLDGAWNQPQRNALADKGDGCFLPRCQPPGALAAKLRILYFEPLRASAAR
jgi:hypothetical protein